MILEALPNSCFQGTDKKVKRQPTEWENTFLNSIPSKRLVSRVYNEFLQLNNKIQSKDDKGFLMPISTLALTLIVVAPCIPAHFPLFSLIALFLNPTPWALASFPSSYKILFS
jgi:hypothetical protein